jgi:hypothetical protein
VREAATALIAALRRLDASAVLAVLNAVLHSSSLVSTSISTAASAGAVEAELEDWRMLASAPSVATAVTAGGSGPSATAVGGGMGAGGARAVGVRTVPQADELLRCYHRDRTLIKAVTSLSESGGHSAEASALWSKRLLEQWCIV